MKRLLQSSYSWSLTSFSKFLLVSSVAPSYLDSSHDKVASGCFIIAELLAVSFLLCCRVSSEVFVGSFLFVCSCELLHPYLQVCPPRHFKLKRMAGPEVYLMISG